MGASIDFRATPYIVKKGGTLFAVKVGIAMLLGVVFGRILGEAPIASGAVRRALDAGRSSPR